MLQPLMRTQGRKILKQMKAGLEADERREVYVGGVKRVEGKAQGKGQTEGD